MAYSVEFSRRAERDLGLIFAAIHAADSRAAVHWFDGLQSHIEKRATLPDRGTLTRYDSKLRFLLFGDKPHVYRILYRVDHHSKRVEIVHIRHGARAPLRNFDAQYTLPNTHSSTCTVRTALSL